MKHYIPYLFAGVIAIAWSKGVKKETSNKIIESNASYLDGSNWQGDMWARLNGQDLVSYGFPNIGGTANADPGMIGRISTNINPGWNGSLGAHGGV